MRVVIAGGSGLVGRALTRSLADDGHEVVVLSRNPSAASRRLAPGMRVVRWTPDDPDDSWVGELSGATAVVNLSGAIIGGRPWTAGRKREILDSRVGSNRSLVAAIGRIAPDLRPKVFVTASGVDYYGNRGDEIVTEESSPGDSFLARVCVLWEAAATEAELIGLRVVAVRTAFVLAPDAPALRLLVLPFRLFLGGPLGDGSQWFSWIHIDDLVGIYRLAIENAALGGPINAAAPEPRPQREVAHEIARILGRPSWLRAPEWALRLALRDQADLLLHGRRTEPSRATALGYEFRFRNLGAALKDVLAKPVRADRPGS